MAGLFATSANLVTALTASAPGPFGAISNLAATITVNVGAGSAGQNTVLFSATSGDDAYATMPAQIAASNGMVFGFGYYFSSYPSATTGYIFNATAGTGTLGLLLNATGQLIFSDCSGTHTTGGVLTTSTRHYVEVYVPTFAASQTVIIMVDGVTYLTVTNANCNTGYPVTMNLGVISTASASNVSFTTDSIYVCDTTGTQNNYFLGPRVVSSAIAAGVGQYSAYTPNGAATLWQCMDSTPAPGDTTYGSDATAGDQTAVTLGTISSLGSVNFVYVQASARQEVSAGGRTLAVGVGNGTATSYGSTQSLTTTYGVKGQVFDQNPVTGSPWTVGNLGTLQAAVMTVS